MAFVAIIALINGIIGGIGGWFGFANASLESIFGYVLAPLAWIMGVDWSDANLAGSWIGQKLAMSPSLTPVSPHTCKRAARWKRKPLRLSPRFVVLLTLVLSVLSLGHFGYFAKTCSGNRSAWFTGAGSSNAFQPDERDHCRFFIGLA